MGLNQVGSDIASRSKSLVEYMQKGIVTTQKSIVAAFGSKQEPEKSEEQEVPLEILMTDRMMKMLNPQARVDYALQESVLEASYVSSISVHMTYWGDSDCSALMVRALYGIEHRLS